jgi:GDP-mannose 6-dehydrogenase
MTLRIYDPEVQLSRLLGANRRFIEQHIPHIGALLVAELETVVRESEVLVLGSSDKGVAEALCRLVRADQIVVDLVGSAELKQLSARVEGLCW